MYVGVKSRKIPRFLDARYCWNREHWMMTKFGEDDNEFAAAVAAAAKSLQSCLTLCDPIDDNPPGSPVPGIFQARTLEWVAISFSNA